jgi:hypothetical protein
VRCRLEKKAGIRPSRLHRGALFTAFQEPFALADVEPRHLRFTVTRAAFSSEEIDGLLRKVRRGLSGSARQRGCHSQEQTG